MEANQSKRASEVCLELRISGKWYVDEWGRAGGVVVGSGNAGSGMPGSEFVDKS